MDLRPGHPSVARTFTVLITICFLSLPSLSQQAKVLAPHRRIPQRVPKSQEQPLPAAKQGSLVGGLWITDANFKSTMYLKNVVEISAVTVTPILYLSNGKKITLPDVMVGPSGTAIVDINAALQNLGIASFATLSGQVEIQYQWPWVPICATIRVVDTVHSLIFSYGVRPSATTSGQNTVGQNRTTSIAESVWWKQENNVTGFVALANTSASAIPAAIEITDNHGVSLATHTVTISPHGTKMVALPELQSTPNTEGGIRVAYQAPADALEINGGLEDQSVGYSANLRFAPTPSTSAKVSQVTIAELGLMVGGADPMMLFPAGTTFTPYSVLRNISDSPVTVTPTIWWMATGSARSAVLQALTLRPNDSHSLNVMSLISAAGLKNFNGDVNLVFDVQGKDGGLLLAAGSADQSNTYVFEVNPRGIFESGSKSLGYWSTANGDDTMVTVWNPADEAQDFVFRLSFSGGHYLFQIHLGARSTRNFNLSEIIRNQVPDVEGNIIPPGIQEGSATISGIHADPEHILLALDAGIYNVRKATCGGGCIYCDGYTSFGPMSPGSANFAVQATKQYNFYGTWSSGAQYNIANSWGSSQTSVSTVNNSGLATGVANGSASMLANWGPDAVYTGETCFTGGSVFCPAQPASGQGSGTAYVGPYQVEPASTVAQGTFPPGECPTAGNPNPGYLRAVNNQVQLISGAPYPHSVTVSDTIQFTSRIDLGGNGASTGTATTDSTGTFFDQYWICSNACPSSTGETDALQNWLVNGYPLPHVDGVIYKCTSIKVDGF